MSNKKEMLEAAIYDLIFNNKNSFLGAILNEMNITFNQSIPTAALLYDSKKRDFRITINPEFFESLAPQERTAVFHHEILHFTHDHLRRFLKQDTFKQENPSFEERMRHNIAADMAINQYIKNLPSDCVDVKDWKQKNGKPFPLYLTYEAYYELLDKTTQEGSGEGSDDENQEPGNEKEKPGINRPTFEKYVGGSRQVLDEHLFNTEDMSEEEKKKLLEDLKDTFSRAIEKNSFSYDSLPDHIKDLLINIDANIQKLDYKGILKQAIKKHASHSEREATWYRPNKRYGSIAPGSREGMLPLLNVYMDTSGSISHREVNEFLSILSNFLKIGARRCNLVLFHTDIYHKQKYKKNSKFEHIQIESGGTDLATVLNDIKKTHPDLSLILTDGYYSDYNINMVDKVVFIITDEGTVDHPLKRFGKTIKYSALK